MSARQRAEDLLVWYFRNTCEAAGVSWDSDNDTEVRSIVDAILDACRGELAEVRHEAIEGEVFSDQADDMLERRVIALEQIEASRWPRRWLVRARLGRQLRRSVGGYGYLGADFEAKRIQAIGDDMGAEQ